MDHGFKGWTTGCWYGWYRLFSPRGHQGAILHQVGLHLHWSQCNTRKQIWATNFDAETEFKSENRRHETFNDDPGVHDDEDEELQEPLYEYGDEEPVLNEIRRLSQNNNDNVKLLGDLVPDEAKDHMLNDYQGLGGPETVPLHSPWGFERPPTLPHNFCLLDELYLNPTPEQIDAFKRIESRKQK